MSWHGGLSGKSSRRSSRSQRDDDSCESGNVIENYMKLHKIMDLKDLKTELATANLNKY
jgi:hypothetical protein